MAALGTGAGCEITAQMDADFFLGLVGSETVVLNVGMISSKEYFSFEGSVPFM